MQRWPGRPRECVVRGSVAEVIESALDNFRPCPRTWADWQQDDARLAGLDFMRLRRRLLDRGVPNAEKDALLAALICRCQRNPDDGQARTAVIVCLLPGLRSIVRRYQDILGRSDAWAEVVSSLYVLAHAYDLARRPERVAANLLWDCTNRLLRCVRQERAWRDHNDLGFSVNCFVSRSSPISESWLPDPLGEGASHGILDSIDVALIAATRLTGVALADAGSLLGLSYEAAKKRRQRAEAGWVQWWAPELLPRFVSPPSLVDSESSSDVCAA